MKDNIHSNFLLIDGSNFIFRSFFGTKPKITSKGQFIHSIVAMLQSIDEWKQIYKDFTPAVIIDSEGKNFRHQICEYYKENSNEPPSAIKTQVQPLNYILRAMGIPVISVPSVESVDVLGTLAAKCSQQGRKCIVATNDTRLYQLINHNISVLNISNGKIIDEQVLIKTLGIPPQRIADYLSLIGDVHSNIKGLYRCGPSLAKKLLVKYNSSNNLSTNPPSTILKRYSGQSELANFLRTSKDLFTIRTDVALSNLPWDKSLYKENEAELQKLKDKYELISKYNNDSLGVDSEVIDYRVILDYLNLDELKAAILSCNPVTFLCVTSKNNKLLGLAFKVGRVAYYVPLFHDYENAPTQLGDYALKKLKPFLESGTEKWTYDAKKQYKILNQVDISLNGVKHDLMLLSFIKDSREIHSLAHILNRNTKKSMPANNCALDDKADLETTTINTIAIDLSETLESINFSIESLAKQLDYEELFPYNSIEIPFTNIISKMEIEGMIIDKEKMHAIILDEATNQGDLLQIIKTKTGIKTTLGSDKEVADLVYSTLDLGKYINNSIKGKRSISKETLNGLVPHHEAIKHIIKYREISNTISHCKSLISHINPVSNKIHTTFNQVNIVTGRISTTSPNLQGTPVKSESGRRLREGFIAANKGLLISADYSQMELRILAHLSKDLRLISAFRQGVDIHAQTASEIFNTPTSLICSEKRDRAKAINFGIIYGMSSYGLAKELNCTEIEAKKYIDLYFSRYPTVYQYINNTVEQAKNNGYVRTLFGRRIYIDGINSKDYRVAEKSKRQAINAPMQGTAADIIKRSMIAIVDWISRNQLKLTMNLQVHDEIILSSTEKDNDAILAGLRICMEKSTPLSIPLAVDIHTGKNWREAH